MNKTTNPLAEISNQSDGTAVGNFAASSDLPSLVGRINAALASTAWCRVDTPMTLSEFESLGAQLGRIVTRTDIMVDPDRQRRQQVRRVAAPTRPGVYQAAALDLHTDRPNAAILAWYCIEPDADRGATQLIDLRDVLQSFSDEELMALGRINVAYTNRDLVNDKETFSHAPLVTRRDNGWDVYFVPWLVEPPGDDLGRELLARFQRSVEEAANRGPIEVRLERGQSLIIANRGILHGRGAIPEDSRRHLVRLYIETED